MELLSLTLVLVGLVFFPSRPRKPRRDSPGSLRSNRSNIN